MSVLFPWPVPETQPSLDRGEVHLWWARLEGEPAWHAGLERTLSDDERARAALHRSESSRRRFVAARGQLRMLLARYLDRIPSSLRFAYGPQGKPALDEPGPSFSVSHSGGRALFAIGCERQLGVDLEALDESIDHEAIAERFLAPGEAAALSRLPEARRALDFFTRWVRLEACAKARGEGLAGLAPEAAGAAVAGFSLHELSPSPGYVAAVAMEGTAPLRCFAMA